MVCHSLIIRKKIFFFSRLSHLAVTSTNNSSFSNRNYEVSCDAPRRIDTNDDRFKKSSRKSEYYPLFVFSTCRSIYK